MPGDVEAKAWNDMIAAQVPLRANVLVASHHGRNSGHHDDALDLIRPEVVIISSDNIPAKDDAIKNYKQHSTVFSTREHGTLTVRMHDGGLVQILDRDDDSCTRCQTRSPHPPKRQRELTRRKRSAARSRGSDLRARAP